VQAARAHQTKDDEDAESATRTSASQCDTVFPMVMLIGLPVFPRLLLPVYVFPSFDQPRPIDRPIGRSTDRTERSNREISRENVCVFVSFLAPLYFPSSRVTYWFIDSLIRRLIHLVADCVAAPQPRRLGIMASVDACPTRTRCGKDDVSNSVVHTIALGVERDCFGAETVTESLAARIRGLFADAEFVRVSRVMPSSTVYTKHNPRLLFVTDDLRRRGHFSLNIVGYDTSLTACCIAQRSAVQLECSSLLLVAQPIMYRDIPLGALIIGSSSPLGSEKWGAMASLAEALGETLVGMRLSDNMLQLLAWRQRDRDVFGVEEMEFQDVPVAVERLSLSRPRQPEEVLAYVSASSKEPEEYSKTIHYDHTGQDYHEKGQACRNMVETCKDDSLRQEGRNRQITIAVRILGLSILYLSALFASRIITMDSHLPISSLLSAGVAVGAAVTSAARIPPGVYVHEWTALACTKKKA
jgi:hypothetical protein